MKPPLRPTPHPLIFWVIWTALISAVFIYQFALGQTKKGQANLVTCA